MNFKKLFLFFILAAGFCIGGHALAQEKDFYYCPMHHQVTSDKPGKCHICGMDLVKKKKEASAVGGGSADHAAVSISPAKQQLMGLKTAVVAMTNATKIVRAAGHVATNHELFQLQDEYVQAYTAFVKAFPDYKRYQHRRRTWEAHRDVQIRLHEAEDKLLALGLSMEQLEKLQDFSWKTPWDQPALLFLKDHLDYWVTAEIFESDLGFVEVGQEVEIEVPSYREKIKGSIRSIGGTINTETRTAKALIDLKDNRSELKANMFATVSIHAQLGEVLLVPRDAVMDTGLRKIVFVQTGDGVFQPREIQTSWETDEGFEVISGLKAGERIVVSGNFLLDSESRVEAQWKS